MSEAPDWWNAQFSRLTKTATSMRDPILPPSQDWIDLVHQLQTFSLKGLSRILLMAFRGGEKAADDFVAWLNTKIKYDKDREAIDTHVPVFRLDVTGKPGSHRTLRILFVSRIRPKSPLLISILIEKDKPFALPGSIIVLSEID